MKVLIACEESQVVCKAFRARGHEAYSCDIQSCSGGHPKWHIEGDVMDLLVSRSFQLQNGELRTIFWWDFKGFHPDCTYMANSGVRWLYNKDGSKNIKRWIKLEAAVIFFNALKSQITTGYLENPIPHKYARDGFNSVVNGEWVKGIGKYTQIIQPTDFGHTTRKATCLWLYGLPKLEPTKIIPKEERTFEIHKEPPGPNRQRNRSRTFEGIANAMAEQWG